MTVGVKVDYLWFPIGTGDFFHAFFSTICVNLEEKNWGKKFPIIMNDLYKGSLSKRRLNLAKLEILLIESELSRISPDKVVWDVEDLSKLPPWGNDISEDITNLAEYFVTTNGKNLISVLKDAIEQAIEEGAKLEIKSL